MAVNGSGLKAKLDADKRDVSDLWKDALKQYKGIVGFELERKFDNVQGMIDFGGDQMMNFHKFRHDKGKVDKLRSLFAANLDLIEQGSQQLVSAAAPAFPPAAAIGTALTYVLKACRQVSADYDVVVVFFDDMNSFLKRITILETRLPRYKAYQNCLMEVFSSFLSMCGFAQKYIELGRFKKWITNLFKGEDGDLGGARANMNQRLEHLQQATEFAILGNTEETLKMTALLEENQLEHTQMLKQVGEKIDTIHENTESIRDDVSKLLKLFGSQKKQAQAAEKPQTKKPPSASGVRHAMPFVINEDHEWKTLMETMVPDTCQWIFSETSWTEWIALKDGTRPVFGVSAQPGAGKSHMAATIHGKLRSLAQEDETHNTCVAHFYFREREDNYAWFICGIITIINQVAEQNGAACEKFSSQIARDDLEINAGSWQELVTHLLGVVFGENSKYHLFIVLDGLDELKDFASFKEFLSTFIIEKKLRISLAVTSRPAQLKDLPDGCESVVVEATKEKQLQDMKALIWHRINSLDHLRTYSRFVQQKVADGVQEASPNLLFAEHLLVRYNALGREGAVLKALKQPKPENLNGVYEILLAECQRRMTLEHQVIASTLLHWIAFAQRPLTLIEVEALVKLLSEDDKFDLEEIPEVFTKFLKIGDAAYDLELRQKHKVSQTTEVTNLPQVGGDDDDDDIYNDGALPVGFQERSMRHFFTTNATTVLPFRWSSSEAHRRILLFSLKIARPDRTDVNAGLQKYGSVCFFKHWSEMNPAEHTDSELAEIFEAMAETMSNKTGMAEMLGRAGIRYGKTPQTEANNAKMAEWAKLLDERGEIRAALSESALAWWQETGKSPDHCRLGFAKGFLGDLYRSTKVEDAAAAYVRLTGVLSVSESTHLIMEQAVANFPDEFPKDKGTPPFDEGTGILGVLHLFKDDVKADAGAYRAVADLLMDGGYYNQAEKLCVAAFELCKPTEEEWYRVSNVLSDVLLLQKKKKAALRISTAAAEQMVQNGVSPSLQRLVHTTKARAEHKMGLSQVALDSYAAAKAADPEGATSGRDLCDELSIQEAKTDKSDYIQLLKSWNLLDRITWVAWDFPNNGDERYLPFCDIAAETGEQQFIVKFYEEIIEFLDHLDAGTPIRIVLALVYLEVCRKPEKTLEILDAIFDSHASPFLAAITGAHSSWMIEQAVDVMVNAQSELFRKSRDPAYKAERIAALSGLLKRPFSLDVPQGSPAWTGQQRIGLSYMYMIMGPLTKFQETLSSLLEDCFNGLSDSVGFNDGPFLQLLAQCLAILSRALRGDEKIKRYARIVGSAIFSRLDPLDPAEESEEKAEGDAPAEAKESGAEESKGAAEEEEESESDNASEVSEDEEPPEEEGDLFNPEDNYWVCDGICKPSTELRWWGKRTFYLYTYGRFICEECQVKYDMHARGEAPLKGRHFHGIGHDNMKLPVEGWRGVRNGMLTLEGEEPVSMGDFFKMLRDEVCTDAWERLWTHGV